MSYSVQSTWAIAVTLAAKGFDPGCDLLEPRRNRRRLLQLLQLIVVAKAKRSDAALPLERPELERLQRQRRNLPTELLFDGRRHEVVDRAQAFGAGRKIIKKGELRGHIATYGVRASRPEAGASELDGVAAG